MGCSGKLNRFQKQFFAMDTVVDLTLYAGSEKEADELSAELKLECDRLDSLFGASHANGAIFKINHRLNKKQAVTAPEVAKLIQTALDYGTETGGLFDITIGPIKWLWGLGSGETLRKPSPAEIAALLSHVDYRKVQVHGDTLFFSDSSIQLDLGGIAKGYALVRMAEMVRRRGISSFMVNAGGDILVGEAKPVNKPWVIGVEHPRDKGKEPILKIDAVRTCVITSGDYERFFFDHGIRYHHLFDPKTGYPARGIISSTVLCSDPIRGVVYSKVLLVNSRMQGMENLQGLSRFILIDDSLRINDSTLSTRTKLKTP